jgi:hypothetical protein
MSNGVAIAETISNYWILLPVSLITGYAVFSFLSITDKVNKNDSPFLFFVCSFAALMCGLGAIVSVGCLVSYNH